MIEGVVPAESRAEVLAITDAMLDELATLYKAICLLGELTPRTLDMIVSYGERMSCVIVSRPKWIVENPGREGFPLSFSQQFCCAGWQDDLPCAGVGFGISCHQPAALFPVKSSVDFQDTAALVEVRPHETADFTPAQADGQIGRAHV